MEQLPLSPLQLLEVLFVKSSAAAVLDGDREEGAETSDDLLLASNLGYDPKEDHWILDFSVATPDNTNKAYVIDFQVRGLFTLNLRSLANTGEALSATTHVATNGGAILWGHLREHILAVTGRCINGTFTLPTVAARLFTPVKLDRQLVDSVFARHRAEIAAPAETGEEGSKETKKETAAKK